MVEDETLGSIIGSTHSSKTDSAASWNHPGNEITTKYQYEPLNIDRDEIRLLTLLPGPITERISIKLEIVQFQIDHPPNFEALSYAWSEAATDGLHEENADTCAKLSHTPDNPSSVYIAGSNEVLPVRNNLNSALRHLRSVAEPRVLWVDAICVNQEDLEERSNQVQKFKHVYSLASQVVVWLGAEQDRSGQAMHLLKEMSHHIVVDWMYGTISPASHDDVDSRWSALQLNFTLRCEEYLAIHNLLGRSWFERLWIRQEVQLSRRAAVVCGHDTISWEDFREATYLLNWKNISYNELPSHYRDEFRARVRFVYELCRYGMQKRLAVVLYEGRKSKCSDPRDRVYACLSLTDQSLQDLVKPDYTATVMEVYENLLAASLKCTQRLDEVGLSGVRDCNGLPTMVPNWDNNQARELLPVAMADGNFLADAELSGKTLKALGLCMGTLSRATPSECFPSPTYSQVMSELLRLCPDSDVLESRYVRGGTFFDAYHATICCNNFRGRNIPYTTTLPGYAESSAALRSWLGQVNLPESSELLNLEEQTFLRRIDLYLRDRSFFQTQDGSIGLGPADAKAGDKILILLGCHAPLIVREVEGNQYQVVGQSYVHGLMFGEAFYGPLDEAWEVVRAMDEDSGLWYTRYRNRDSGELYKDDPRLPPLVHGSYTDEGWARIFHDGNGDPRLQPKELRRPDLDIQHFKII